jgi:transposase-like protein
MELHMNPFKGRHFQRDIILWAVRWYCKYGISYRELQEMLAERGVNVDHSTIYRWVQRYAPEKWKNGCAGTGVTLPIFARGTWMKPT